MSAKKTESPPESLPPVNKTEQPVSSDESPKGITRRSFISRVSAAGIVVSASPLLRATDTAEEPQAAAAGVPGAVPVVLKVNGEEHRLQLEPRVTLLDTLRERLYLFGTKKGCDHGQCGACTVHINGRRVVSCLNLAIMHQGDEITTIEGLEKNGQLHPMQAAFLEHDGFQCGYCTSGQIMSAAALIHEGHAKSDAEIREWMSGNICRCGAYPNIVAAIRDAAKEG